MSCRRHQKNHAQDDALMCEYSNCGKVFFRLDLLHRHQERQLVSTASNVRPILRAAATTLAIALLGPIILQEARQRRLYRLLRAQDYQLPQRSHPFRFRPLHHMLPQHIRQPQYQGITLVCFVLLRFHELLVFRHPVSLVILLLHLAPSEFSLCIRDPVTSHSSSSCPLSDRYIH
jgi:hypothetical protein